MCPPEQFVFGQWGPWGTWETLKNIFELFPIRVKVSLINLFHPPSTRYSITRPQRSNLLIARSSSMAILGSWLFWEGPLACNLGVLFSSSGVFLVFLLCFFALFGWFWLAFLLSEGFVFSGLYLVCTDLRPVHTKYNPEKIQGPPKSTLPWQLFALSLKLKNPRDSRAVARRFHNSLFSASGAPGGPEEP